MLRQLNQLLTRCPLHLREMGFVREMWGIRKRYLQWRDAWEPHCQRTRAVILAAAGRCPRRRTAVVFGSGWLHDVPIAELCNTFSRVVLVDLFHPFSVRWFVSRWRNASLVTGDVSEVLEPVWRAVEQRADRLPESRPSLFLDDPEVDLVVSLNLLSQLPCMPSWYLRRYASFTEPQIDAFCKQVVEAHRDYLPRLPGVVCLVADVELISRIQLGGEEVSRRSTLYGASFPWPVAESWEWPFVPRSPRPPHHAESLRVVAVPDVKQPPAAVLTA